MAKTKKDAAEQLWQVWEEFERCIGKDHPGRTTVAAPNSSPMPANYGPREFVMFVTNMVGVNALDPKLPAKDALDPKLPAKERELLHRQGVLLSTAFAELEKALTEGQPDHAREHRMFKLWQALGAACFIGSNCAKGPVNDWMMAARATEGRKKKLREWRRKWQDDVERLAAIIWRNAPGYPSRDSFHPWKIAAKIKRENKIDVSEYTIGRHLSKNWKRVKDLG